jgi:hypothetical protein
MRITQDSELEDSYAGARKDYPVETVESSLGWFLEPMGGGAVRVVFHRDVDSITQLFETGQVIGAQVAKNGDYLVHTFSFVLLSHIVCSSAFDLCVSSL